MSVKKHIQLKVSTSDEEIVPNDIERISFQSNTDSQDRKIRFGYHADDEEKYLHRATFADEIEQVSMRLVQRPCPITCQKFLPVEEYAELFVNEITEDSAGRTMGIREYSAVRMFDGVEYKEDDSMISRTSVATYVCVLEWPTIGEFTVEIGTNKILEFISYWKYKEEWKYAIIYLRGESDQTSDFHYYEVMFSIPCQQYPIPQATASVYFTIEVSRVRPKHCLIEVDFCFETQRFRHKPANFEFQEVFLFNIIDAKINFYKTLTF